jgi:peptidoglycan/xylan/chitin deacetylase (PgdA/CDA1 family)
MRLLSPILHRVIYPVLGSAGYFHSRPAASVTVITYHGVLPAGYKSADAFLDNTIVTEESFRMQLRLLKKHFNVISPDDFVLSLRQRQELPERAILLTCDDGLLNHLNVMVPILREERLKCLFFVTGSSLGDAPALLWYLELYLLLMQAPTLDGPIRLQSILIPEISADLEQRRSLWLSLLRSLSRVHAATRRRFLEDAAAKFGLQPSWKIPYVHDPVLRNRFQLLRLPEMKKLGDAGMTIGAHTLSHPILAEQSLDLARGEIAECRSTLEQSLGRSVWAIAYPFGDPGSVATREFRLAEEAGYECAFVNVGGVLDAVSARFALPRVHITAEMSLSVYEAYVSGFHHALWTRFRGQKGGFAREKANGG